jgi:hypothetical protein
VTIPRGGALTAVNVAAKSEDGLAPAVHVKAGQEGTLVFRMPSSYVYLGGTLEFDAQVGNEGRLTVGYSENNGLDWKEVAKRYDDVKRGK